MRRRAAVTVHALVREPRPPGPWVDSEGCACGAVYADFRPGARFADAAARLRVANGREVWPSRGPVLWLMRVAKLEEWYMAHCGCDPGPARARRRRGR